MDNIKDNRIVHVSVNFALAFTICRSWATETEIADFILSQRTLIYLQKNTHKFNLQNYECVRENAKIENVDSVMMHDVLTPGHLCQKFLADTILKKLEIRSTLLDEKLMVSSLRSSAGVSRAMESFLATDSASSHSCLGLTQRRGEYQSHALYVFRVVHRALFFITTEGRQLLHGVLCVLFIFLTCALIPF
uniref:Uncharacterized protein n=1 Tax=Glossina austeni TaxID=7395 RepID=A0A1A9V203_GLOAU